MCAVGKAGERVMAVLRKCYAKLHLKVNETKSAVAQRVWPQVSGLQPLAVAERRGQTRGGRQGRGDVQATDPAN